MTRCIAFRTDAVECAPLALRTDSKCAMACSPKSLASFRCGIPGFSVSDTVFAHARPKTTMSRSEFAPRRFAPCTDADAHSPAAMHGGDHGDGFFRDVHAREDRGGLRDAREPLRENLGREVVEVEVDVVLLRADAAPFANLHRHRPRHDVSRREIFRRRRVPLHEPLALAVAQDPALAAASLGDQAPGAVDPRRVELHELEVLQRQTRARHHRVPVPGARVRARGAEVRAAVPAGREDRLVRSEPMDRPVLHAHRDDADALA
eukprot:31518-Pelagococcus_subviridis.AAC.9